MISKSFTQPISKDVDDLLEILNRFSVEYLLVGAHAVMVYTEPRFTKDIDLWINATPDNSERVFLALREFGAPLKDITAKDFSESGFFYTLGIAPGRIDLLMGISGIEFLPAFQKAERISYGGRDVLVLSKEDLITAKRAAGRPQDLLDLEKLLSSNG